MIRALAVCLLATLALPVYLLAQARPSRPAPTPIVTVTKTDGTTVRGKLVGSDRDGVTVEPTAKPKGQESAVPGDIPWSEVKTVSNGLTREKAVAQWKEAHHDELCPDCHGNGATVCPTCKGTGHDPASSKDCKTCKGEQTVACKAPRCKDGKVPCPGPCLKLTSGVWKKLPGKGDLLWHEVPVPAAARRGRGATVFFSDHHVGDIITFDASGNPKNTPCPTCGKTGVVDCPVCDGTAHVPCPTCTADKSAADCADCEAGHKPCATCGGTGLAAKADGGARPATPAAPGAGQNR